MKTTPTNSSFALITGASKGLGRSYALELARRNHSLLLVAAENDGLPLLADFIRKKYSVEVNIYEGDLTREETLHEIVAWVSNNYQLDILINNAGMGAACAFGDASFEFVNRMIQLNIRALTLLTHQLLPQLAVNKAAYILNVASMIAFSPSGYKSVYPASKCFVHNFSLCLSEELKDTNVHVAVVYPGTMRTNEFVRERIKKHNGLVKAGVVPTEIVASVSLKKLFNHKKIIIVGWANYLMWFLMRVTPPPVKLSLITNAMKREVLLTHTKTEIS